jgi:signal transduction histidine kinase
MDDDRPAGRLAGQAFAAIDAAAIAIAQELTLERILQVIVDRVRPLVGARYAALGLPGPTGHLERFITSGITEQERARIGHPPLGLGLLGVIVREGTAIRIEDMSTDPRHVGFPPEHPLMRSLLGVPIQVEGLSIGNLYLTDKEGGAPFTEEDQRIVEAFARHAGLAIHNARMHEELQHLAVLRERDRIGQDLHDGIIQSLYGVGLSLEDVAELASSDPSEVEPRVERAIDAIHAVIRDIRSFIMGLRPEALDGAGLAGALRTLAEEFRYSTLVDVQLELGEHPVPDPDSTLQLAHLAREALSNVARHASASLVTVRLSGEGGVLRLSIADDGRGFDPLASRGPSHQGLANMRARAEALGGRLSVESRPGGGTRIEFELPPADAGHVEERNA